VCQIAHREEHILGEVWHSVGYLLENTGYLLKQKRDDGAQKRLERMTLGRLFREQEEGQLECHRKELRVPQDAGIVQG